ncbi:MAG: tetratricopeptide repeat protein [Gammaproteobacteria bacterium]|jgi:Flp pilus assembly protein TadD|nr:tetratricopeptide repeat protein [Gammaproteobacteria bacterium]
MKPEIIEDMIAKGRDSYEARLAAGQARLRADEPERAIEHLRKALEFKPGQTMAWQELGKACKQVGDVDAARDAWRRGLEVAVSNGDKQAEKVMRVWLRRIE